MPARRAARRLAVTGAVLAVLGTAACGGSLADSTEAAGSPSTPDAQHPWGGLTGEAREKALLEAAQEEGPLSVYSGYNDEKSMAEAFTKKYGIKRSVQRDSESVRQRVMQERSANKPQNDVLINPSPDIQVAQSQGVLGV